MIIDIFFFCCFVSLMLMQWHSKKIILKNFQDLKEDINLQQKENKKSHTRTVIADESQGKEYYYL